MKPILRVMAPVLMTLMVLLPSTANAGGLGRAFERGAMRSLRGSAQRGAERGALRSGTRSFFRREHLRDLRTPSKPLARPRTVYRYVPAPKARSEMRRGIAPGRHFTSRPAKGRPLGAARAQKAYGLPRKPGAVETVRIPAGHPVRFNKTLGGSPGRGELTSPKHLAPSSVHSLNGAH